MTLAIADNKSVRPYATFTVNIRASIDYEVTTIINTIIKHMYNTTVAVTANMNP